MDIKAALSKAVDQLDLSTEEMQDVMRILGEEMELLFQNVPSNVLVCKFINKDLRPDNASVFS